LEKHWFLRNQNCKVQNTVEEKLLNGMCNVCCDLLITLTNLTTAKFTSHKHPYELREIWYLTVWSNRPNNINISDHIKQHPMYSSYTIESYEMSWVQKV
jgi:hypothetical protein